MIIYYSMIAWIALIGIVNLSMRQRHMINSVQARRLEVPIWCVIAVIGYIVFWVALRTRFADTPAYISMFNMSGGSLSDIPEVIRTSDKMPGYDVFQVIVKSLISSNYHVFFLIVALIQAVSIMFVFRKYSENFFFSAYLFITELSFFWMMNGIRQFIAVSVIFACTPWILKRKWVPYVIVVLLMSTVHYTALMMIPVYWIVTCKPWSRKMMIGICALVLMAVFSERFTSILEASLSSTAYAGATEQFASDDGVNPIRVVVYSVPVALSLVCRRRLAIDNKPIINLCINMSALSAGLYLVGVFTSGILIGRLPIYCSMYNLILYPYIFNHCFTPTSKRIMYIFCTIGYLAFFYMIMGDSFYCSDLTGLIW